MAAVPKKTRIPWIYDYMLSDVIFWKHYYAARDDQYYGKCPGNMWG